MRRNRSLDGGRRLWKASSRSGGGRAASPRICLELAVGNADARRRGKPRRSDRGRPEKGAAPDTKHLSLKGRWSRANRPRGRTRGRACRPQQWYRRRRPPGPFAARAPETDLHPAKLSEAAGMGGKRPRAPEGTIPGPSRGASWPADPNLGRDVSPARALADRSWNQTAHPRFPVRNPLQLLPSQSQKTPDPTFLSLHCKGIRN